MKNKKNRKKTLAIATIVATLLLIAAGTYAFTAYTEWVKNHFQSSGMEEGKVTIVEEFTPPKDLAPGSSYKKKVAVKNTGAGKYLVRASFEEGSSRIGNLEDTTTKILKEETPGPVSDKFPVILNSKTFAEQYNVIANADFTVKDVQSTNPNLVLLINKKDNATGILANIVEVTADDFPGEDFVTNQMYDTSGNSIDFTATPTVKVYQKVTIDNGDVKKNSVSGKFDITGTPLYSQFNTSITKTKSNKQGTWTKKQVFVSDTTQAGKVTAAEIVLDGTIPTIKSKIDPQVTLQFNETLGTTFPATVGDAAASDKWIYNESDGYFYYLDVLDSEKQTASFLEKVKFDKSDVNLLSSYNLYVGIEAIPADLEALTFAGTDSIDPSTVTPVGDPKTWSFKTGNGWDLKEADTTAKPVLDYYKALIAAR